MFAQAGAYCALRQDRPRDRRSKHGFRTSWRTLRKVCNLLRTPLAPPKPSPTPDTGPYAPDKKKVSEEEAQENPADQQADGASHPSSPNREAM